MYGPWTINNLTADEYTRKAQQWAHALKLVDPSITLVSSGQNGYNLWDTTLLQGLAKFVRRRWLDAISLIDSHLLARWICTLYITSLDSESETEAMAKITNDECSEQRPPRREFKSPEVSST